MFHVKQLPVPRVAAVYLWFYVSVPVRGSLCCEGEYGCLRWGLAGAGRGEGGRPPSKDGDESIPLSVPPEPRPFRPHLHPTPKTTTNISLGWPN